MYTLLARASGETRYEAVFCHNAWLDWPSELFSHLISGIFAVTNG